MASSRGRTTAVFGLLVLLLPLRTVRGEEPRRPWEWPLEERIAARLDPGRSAARTERERRRRAESAARYVGSPVLPPVQFVIDGATEPELLLPFELFGSLLNGLDEFTGAATRRQYAADLACFGWEEDDFWQFLTAITAGYEQLSTRALAIQMTLRRSSPAKARALRAELDTLHAAMCGLRADALLKLRQTLPRFDEFLYRAVAPNVSLSGRTPGPGEGQRLLWVEGGCKQK